ncbi:hypothetical protein [Lacrimispora aerotolerans]|uniref:hypothetical protein n=1 Tax=Lacrimispora aerotolerans TaxID=36832 RepID=UPI0004786F01|nr:hypothetical protein [Lacrimispora aerotolerans]
MNISTLSSNAGGLNIQSINRSAATKNETLNGIKAEKTGTDVATISPAGKKQSMIEQLMKQKEYLQERKQSIIDSAAENGSTDLEQQLKEYEQQIKDIDEQITKLQTEDKEKKESDDTTGMIYDKPKTKEEVQTDQLNGLTALSNGTDQTEVLSSVKGKLDGQITVMNAEVHSMNGSTESKIEKISELKSRSQKISSDIAEKLGDSLDSISSRNEEIAKPEVEVRTEEKDSLLTADTQEQLESNDSQA